jgi:hypothetical protein
VGTEEVFEAVRRRVWDEGTPLVARQEASIRARGLFRWRRESALVPDLAPKPASEQAVREAEALLGESLPPLLRRIFLEIANGGIGPGYGLLGVRGGHADDMRNNGLDLLAAEHLQTEAVRLWPLCHWGCAIYSLVECPSGRMWAFDPNPAPEDVNPLVPVSDSIEEWMLRWTEDRLIQPCLVQDTTTGEWRAATEAELRSMIGDD